MRLALISGITSGTFGSMRKAEELSTTIAPDLTAAGANFLEMPLPAENSAISTPSKERSETSSITTFWPRNETALPADRALASAFNLPTRKPRLSMVAMNSAPTAPVTPTIATTGSLLTWLSIASDHAADSKKAPDQSRAGLRVKVCDGDGYVRTAPEPSEGFVVLVVRFADVGMGATYERDFCRRQRLFRRIQPLALCFDALPPSETAAASFEKAPTRLKRPA